MPKRGPKPKKINTEWSSDLAYVVGIFASDGNIGKDGMYLEVTSADKDIVLNVKNILDLKNIKIGTKSSGSGTTAYRIQFKRVLFHTWLQSIGFIPNKSKTLGPLKIPDEYFFDFVRGVWDGDGTIYCTKDKRWKNSYIVSIGFASGSIDFLKWLQENINTNIGSTGHMHTGKRALQLRYARKDSKKLFDVMFSRKNSPYLKRKFTKAQKIFRMTGL